MKADIHIHVPGRRNWLLETEPINVRFTAGSSRWGSIGQKVR